ncbi:MTH865 family protein [Salinirarus marinus]|uniref:MTH865 family protein n=1 Tax=Salinirarus marinus TaxID=3068310 RepID=UPI003C6C5795
MADEDVEADIRAQLREALSSAEYPVSSQMDLVPALPEGPATRFESGDVSISAMEMATKLGGHQEFPYEDVDDLVDDVMAALKSEGLL